MQRWRVLLLGLVAGACTRTLQTSTTQLRPVGTTEDLAESDPLQISTKDMELPKVCGADPSTGEQICEDMKLPQRVQFKVVSRDRLRFHVSLVHKWQEYADVEQWNARLVDDQGHTYNPITKERRKNVFMTKMWDHELRSAQRNRFGDIVDIRNDGYKRRVYLDAMDLFKGQGDVVFYARDLFTKTTKSITLIMDKGGLQYRFTWNFADPQNDNETDEPDPHDGLAAPR